MSRRLKAVYLGGAFIPKSPCDLPEDSEVELLIEGPFIIPPEMWDSQERALIIKRLVERMQQNPIPPAATHLTREALHERR